MLRLAQWLMRGVFAKGLILALESVISFLQCLYMLAELGLRIADVSVDALELLELFTDLVDLSSE